MPKIVDHDQRRAEIVSTTWRIIAAHGIAGATLRGIAAEAGYANGAIKPYFATKRDLLRATFEYVFGRTNLRSEPVLAGFGGVAALLAFGREVLPLDADRADEARVVVAYWQESVGDPELGAVHAEAMALWREWMAGWIAEGQAAGELSTALNPGVMSEVLLSFLLGSQLGVAVEGRSPDSDELVAQLEALVASWAA